MSKQRSRRKSELPQQSSTASNAPVAQDEVPSSSHVTENNPITKTSSSSADSSPSHGNIVKWFITNLTSNLFFGVVIALLLLILSYFVNRFVIFAPTARTTATSGVELSTSTGSLLPTAGTIYLNEGSGTTQVSQGQMLILADYYGVAVVKFDFSNDGAAYRWRYKRWKESTEQTGSGLLYEHISWTPTSEGSTGVDTGSLLTITIKNMQVVWSRRSLSSGWIYYKTVGIAVLDDSGYDTLNLANVRMRS
jgi:hypothetical protein